MSETVIRVEKLGKRYVLGRQQKAGLRYRALRDDLMDMAKAPFRWARNGFGANHAPEATGDETFWALQDVSFEIRRGEIVGIIGRNGAGKSTLLKILSRITEPTTGSILLKGRVASLLEVGTGFHQELTGRENIYLNGAILGMHRSEIKAKFDEIVAFAEVEKFLDTPVKRYSSGMYVRLAFAVAAHLEPEILIVDEVLAVGDAEFQKKCLGKMDQVAHQGRTVLVVSHNMTVVNSLCTYGVLLQQGRVVARGARGEVVERYLAQGQAGTAETVWPDPRSAPGTDRLRVAAVRVISDDRVSNEVDINADVIFEIDYWVLEPGVKAALSIHLFDQMDTLVLATANFPSAVPVPDEWYGRPHAVGRYRSHCIIPGDFLNEGTYHIHVFLLTVVCNIEFKLENAAIFTVHESGSMRGEYTGDWAGVVRPKLSWRTEPLPEFTAN